MKYLAAILIALLLSGCAGLRTTWVLHMEYQTPDEATAGAKP